MKKGRAHGPAPRACAAARGEAAAGTLPGADERGGGGAAAARGAELLPEPGGGGTGADAVPAGEVPAVLAAGGQRVRAAAGERQGEERPGLPRAVSRLPHPAEGGDGAAGSGVGGHQRAGGRVRRREGGGAATCRAGGRGCGDSL